MRERKEINTAPLRQPKKHTRLPLRNLTSAREHIGQLSDDTNKSAICAVNLEGPKYRPVSPIALLYQLVASLHSAFLHSLPIVRPKPGERVQPIRTQARSATILPNFVGLKFQVHNGKVYHDITVTEDMVGHKLGEFSPTRKKFAYKQTKNK
ncbi:hypothetical protein W97_00522 [Coniosporium apollinis CBS 100218]|uniref:30S ribosomal protein S19 n=1 Tax=Coniosporium apollinis (strain CBS 100218) TaxID=1168221 RepID=R7YHM4_CONA1|nr:uncharacterized protein W97_00522 [Coniosporium apollinis CBS 100218]EON61309.1 hypothetical protein W97_00522 [Coniosporium apollinis CBS 100218]